MSLTGITAYLRPQHPRGGPVPPGRAGRWPWPAAPTCIRHPHVGRHHPGGPRRPAPALHPPGARLRRRGHRHPHRHAGAPRPRRPPRRGHRRHAPRGGLPAAAQRRHHRRAPGPAALQRRRPGPARPSTPGSRCSTAPSAPCRWPTYYARRPPPRPQPDHRGAASPPAGADTAAAFLKFTRTAFDFALLNCAVRVRRTATGEVAECRVVVGETPALGAPVPDAEDALRGAPSTTTSHRRGAAETAAAAVPAPATNGPPPITAGPSAGWRCAAAWRRPAAASRSGRR